MVILLWLDKTNISYTRITRAAVSLRNEAVMSVQEFMDYRRGASFKMRVSMELVLHCAPILKDVKPANIVTVTPDKFKLYVKLLAGTGISWMLLNVNAQRAILYLFRRERLERYLADKDIEDFLAKYGYHGGALEDKLARLANRVAGFGDGKVEFPHEIGIFLGYPLWDVEGFLRNNGENSIGNGYWKVYDDLAGALRTFESFDRSREQAMEELVEGKSIREIAV